MNLMPMKKSRIRSGFVIYSYLDESALQRLKGMQSSELGMLKFVNRRMKGVPFC